MNGETRLQTSCLIPKDWPYVVRRATHKGSRHRTRSVRLTASFSKPHIQKKRALHSARFSLSAGNKKTLLAVGGIQIILDRGPRTLHGTLCLRLCAFPVGAMPLFHPCAFQVSARWPVPTVLRLRLVAKAPDRIYIHMRASVSAVSFCGRSRIFTHAAGTSRGF